ncbi:MAG: hypothetical protein F2771_01420 [Actinobacteria bacterium]|uniref:Unannotated protein n=2 Tax=freshwater metagenome TaxID=449393 RepID=A0A6J6NN26_9ZZZZ|nr:hypothetical protein [Actinomycetota bacterium]
MSVPMSALKETVLEIERECAKAGWTRGIVLYALVPTADVIESAPEMAEALAEKSPTSLTAIEQEDVELTGTIEDFLGTISWSAEVFGAALVLERLIVNEEPPGELSQEALAEWVIEHGQEVRMVVGVLRDGSQECAMRMRAYDDENAIMAGPELLPGMAEALALTFAE